MRNPLNRYYPRQICSNSRCGDAWGFIMMKTRLFCIHHISSNNLNYFAIPRWDCTRTVLQNTCSKASVIDTVFHDHLKRSIFKKFNLQSSWKNDGSNNSMKNKNHMIRKPSQDPYTIETVRDYDIDLFKLSSVFCRQPVSLWPNTSLSIIGVKKWSYRNRWNCSSIDLKALGMG